MPPSTPPASSESPRAALDRRRALVWFINATLAAVVTAVGGLLGAFALRPAVRETKDRWMRVASLLELPSGTPLPRVLSVPRRDGWYRKRVRQTVFLLRDGDAVKALSATCTHLGCQVRWDREAKRFLCPCHGGAYDAQGRVVQGPPPRPLDTIEVHVDTTSDSVLVRV